MTMAELEQARVERDQAREFALAVGLRHRAMYSALVAAKFAINPLDKISLHEWKGRLDKATKQIDAALAGATDAGSTGPEATS